MTGLLDLLADAYRDLMDTLMTVVSLPRIPLCGFETFQRKAFSCAASSVQTQRLGTVGKGITLKPPPANLSSFRVSKLWMKDC